MFNLLQKYKAMLSSPQARQGTHQKKITASETKVLWFQSSFAKELNCFPGITESEEKKAQKKGAGGHGGIEKQTGEVLVVRKTQY